MIGQQKLVAQIVDLADKGKFPRFSIVVGERGMEHEDVGRVIAERLECPYILLQDVKVDTIRNMIKQAYKEHQQMVYIIRNADDMSINAKNALLKVTEEPPYKAYFVMCLEDINNTLATIKSRGTVFYMDRCKPSDIGEFARSLYKDKPDEKEIEIYEDICSTPGDVLTLQKAGVTDFYKYSEYVAHNICEVSGAELFKFSDKLALKDGAEGYDCLLFLKALQRQFWEMCPYTYKGTDDCGINCICNIVRCIDKYAQDLRIKGINKSMLMDSLYLEMRKIWKSQN